MLPPFKTIPSRRSAQTPDCSTFWLGLALAFGSLWLTPGIFAKQPPPAAAGALENLRNVPLQFEANAGQADAEVKFLSRGRGHTLLLTPTEAHFVFLGTPSANKRPAPASPGRGSDSRHSASQSQQGDFSFASLRLSLVDGNPDSRIESLDALAGTVNHFVGSDSRQWRTAVPTFSRIRCHQVYSGIDLIYYGNQGQLEFDFLVSPGAKTDLINLQLIGADQIEIDREGELVVRVAGESLRWKKPVAYQDDESGRQIVLSEYILKGPDRIGFRLGRYDSTRPLVIDPILAGFTYLGGGELDRGESIAVDNSGNVYVTGQTVSTDFIMAHSVLTGVRGQSDAFITKLNSNGTAIIYSAYFGGSGVDIGFDIAVDSAGQAYVAGSTGSTNLPTRNPFQSALGGVPGMNDAFLAKLGPFGTNLLYSTYFGGSDVDEAAGLAVDNSGNAYLTGRTYSGGTFPKKNPFQPGAAGGDAFVAKFNTTLSGTASLIYSSPLGGNDEEQGNAIALDSSGNAYVAGDIYSDAPLATFPVTNAFQNSYGGGAADGFVAKIGANGSIMLFATYLGGRNEDGVLDIALDSARNIYLTGMTRSTDFPVAHAAQPSLSANGFANNSDAFLVKLQSNGTQLLYSTFLGGDGDDAGMGIAAGRGGLVYLTGETKSENFRVTPRAFQSTNGGGPQVQDAFVALFNLDYQGPESLRFSTYLGNTGGEQGTDIAVDTNGNCYITGQSTSTNGLPVTPGAVQPNFAGGYSDAFVMRILPDPTLHTSREGGTVLLTWPSYPPGFTLERAIAVPTMNWVPVGAQPTTSNGFNRLSVLNLGNQGFYRLTKP